ncbi:MAG: hypothetical protein IT439_09015 [Phycisphaerales bacterium]|nr:hypothetical protein [Phycisphaerales bacterium]
MKLKGVGIVEQHIEKAVLGVVVLVFVAVLAMQFVGGGNKVKIDKQSYPIQRGYEPIVKRAQEVAARMRDPNPSVLPEVAPLGLGAQWAEALQDGPGIPQRLAAIAPRFGPGAADGARLAVDPGATSGEYMYQAIVVPAPGTPHGVPFRSTLDPIGVAMNRDLENICRAQGLTGQPWDASAVTVQTTFNGAALAQSLANDPDGSGTRYAALPEAWWRGNVEVLEIQYEVCNGFDASGNPINPRLVAPLPRPGSEPLTRRIPAQNPTVEQVQAVVERAGDIRGTIQPEYFRVIAGAPWQTPIERARLAAIEAKRPEIERKVRQYEEAVRQAERDQAALVEAAGPRIGRQPPSGGGGGRSGGGGGERPPETAPPSGPNESQLRQLRDKLQRSIKDRDDLLAGLNLLGVNELGEPLPVGDESDIEALSDTLEMTEVYGWTHDLMVRPGDVRRYRARVVVNNPLFGYGRQLAEEQRSLATEPTLASAWSDWSDPVELEGSEYFFVTSASEGATETDPTAMPRVGVEVFKFYYGYWRQGIASLEPGDQLAADIKLPDPALLPIYDVTNIRNAAPPPGQPPRPGTPPGSPGGTNQGRPGDFEPGRGPGPVLPAGATPGPEKIGVSVATWLLDVGTVAGGGDAKLPGSRARLQAYMRDQTGAIVVRPTGEQANNDRYKAMVLSAKEGQDQGAADPKAEPEPKPEPPPRERDRDIPRPPPDGGGGGGGGGGG